MHIPLFTPGWLKVDGESAKPQQRDPPNELKELAAINQPKFNTPLTSFKKFQISLFIQLDQQHGWLTSLGELEGFETF